MLTVKEVARIANVSVRALHHYDSINLLKPAHIGENGYRYYGEAELLRLQQILFYRELGLPLKKVAEYLDQPDFNHLSALRVHRSQLEAEIERYHQLINTIDLTIKKLTGAKKMKNSDLYKGFSPEKQQVYEDWLIDRHGSKMRERIDISKQHLNGQTQEQLDDKMAELATLENSLAEQMQTGVDANSSDLDDLLDQHRSWVAAMSGCPFPLEDYAGLADTYLSHPDFKTRYETIAEGFTVYLTNAMKAYAKRHKSP